MNPVVMHGVPNVNLFDFMCLLVNYDTVLCPSADELQQSQNASAKEVRILLNLMKIDCFVVDSSAFTFHLCDSLSSLCCS